MINTTIAHYKITSKLGQGGMGEVYRATDTKLDRDVAIKILPEEFVDDPKRLARFEREAKALAKLNHANIGTIHGFEVDEGKRYLVMELIEGRTLGERLKRGPLSLAEAVDVCRGIAEALEAAHAKGIIHRDLKPDNVMVTPDGQVKVLDFGIAKALADHSAADATTVTGTFTNPGALLGTPAYMSPEQARGGLVDKRADIWSFGCVLFECLTGKRAFDGASTSEVLGGVMHKEPDWTLLPKNLPSTLSRILQRCLSKETKNRLHDIADARLEVEAALIEASSGPADEQSTLILRWRWLHALPWVGMALLAGVAWHFVRTPQSLPESPEGKATRFSIEFPDTESITVENWWRQSVAVSHNGQRIAYVVEIAGQRHVRIRDLAEFKSAILPHTLGAREVFFSPDGEWLAFFTDRHLKKVAVRTRESVVICDALPVATGGCWDSPDTILFNKAPMDGLLRVGADGGETPLPVTEPDRAAGELAHMHPKSIYGQRAVLMTIRMKSSAGAQLAVFDLDTHKIHRLTVRSVGAYFDPSSNHLIYGQSGSLWAAPFNEKTYRVTGSAVKVAEGVYMDHLPLFAVSAEGTLAYVPGSDQTDQELVWVDQQGQVEPLGLQRGNYNCPRLSPDGRRLAVSLSMGIRWQSDIWLHDLQRHVAPALLTFNLDIDDMPLWSPGGESLVYNSLRDVPPSLYQQSLQAGPDSEKLILHRDYAQFATSWTPDGRFLAVTDEQPETNLDVLILPIEGERKPIPLLASAFSEAAAVFSPDGRWLAVQSDESGRYEIYVYEFMVVDESEPRLGRRWTVSSQGGTEPCWSRGLMDVTLFFRNGRSMISVPFEAGDEPAFGEAEKLFEGEYETTRVVAGYDVAKDGRFIMVRRSATGGRLDRLRVVRNWPVQLAKKE